MSKASLVRTPSLNGVRLIKTSPFCVLGYTSEILRGMLDAVVLVWFSFCYCVQIFYLAGLVT